MKIVVKEPRKPAAVRVIDGTLESMQDIVGGYLDQPIYIDRHVVCICNEEGLIRDLPYNFSLPPHFIYGTAFFCGIDGTDMVGLDDGWIDTILNHFGGGL